MLKTTKYRFFLLINLKFFTAVDGGKPIVQKVKVISAH